ncbi:MAG: hypothetical protein J0M17_09360 [Planctomycetes bacterium]|nr:hypothetical protein [Planctomycetota bacterium]
MSDHSSTSSETGLPHPNRPGPTNSAKSDSNPLRDATQLFSTLLAKAAPVFGLIFFAGTTTVANSKSKPPVPLSYIIGFLIGAGLLAAALAFLGCLALTGYRHFKQGLSQAVPSVGNAPVPPPPPGIADRYWLAFEGRTTGPHATGDLVAAMTRGDFPPESLVCAVGSTQWVPLRSLAS